MVQKTEFPHIYRDDSGALINKNNEALLAYKLKKQQTMKISTIENQIKTLNEDMMDIKNLLLQLSENIKAR
jgi:hypothetical protein